MKTVLRMYYFLITVLFNLCNAMSYNCDEMYGDIIVIYLYCAPVVKCFYIMG